MATNTITTIGATIAAVFVFELPGTQIVNTDTGGYALKRLHDFLNDM